MKKNKVKKIITVILIICICISFSSCWDYVGLNEIGITTGVAIDKEGDKYKLTLEVVDLVKSNKEKGTTPLYVECEGKTVLEAVRNSKSISATKMFWGHIAVIIISEQIAQEEGILKCLEIFQRDAEPRETINIIISQEKTAKDLIMAQGLTTALNALELRDIVAEDHSVTSKTGDVQFYQAIDVLNKQGRELVLPAFRIIKNDDFSTGQSNGVALFNQDKLIGYLSPEDTFFYLFVINEIKGGVFSVQLEEDKEDSTVFEINGSKTKMDYEYDEEKDKFKIIIEIDTNVFIAQRRSMQDTYNQKEIEKIQKEAGEYLEENIKSVIKKVQTEYDSDIFAFGNLIYRKNPKLWDKVSDNWGKYFKETEVEIKSNIHIKNTAFLTN